MTDNEKKTMIKTLIYSPGYKPMKFRELAGFLMVPKNERDELKQILDELIAEDTICIGANGGYKKNVNKRQNGTFCATGRGFAFVIPEDKDEAERGDIFIPADYTGDSMDGDTVEFKITSGEAPGKRREGVVTKVITRANTHLVGTFKQEGPVSVVIPDNPKLGEKFIVQREHTKGARTGARVYLEIRHYPQGNKAPMGKVKEILGDINDPGTDMLATLRAYNLQTEFPEEVIREIEGIPDEVAEKDTIGRKDIRSLKCVTIDGSDAKDLDDAITLEETSKGYRLGVHIADVTNYVKEGSPLDTEAFKRGTSVYLINKVIPMLPKKLSNGICSLNAGVDRLALSCFMDIDRQGTIFGHEICETVIRVTRRMSYDEVFEIISAEDKTPYYEEYGELTDMFLLMEKVSGLLRDKRRNRGSIDFDVKESKIILDENSAPVEIGPYEHNRAMEIIEDFMLAANETVAEEYHWNDIPFLYRVHETPDPEKVKQLAYFVSNFGYRLHVPKDEIHPMEFQKLISDIEGSDEAALISRLTLRSMRKACYKPECLGHFGLAAKYYCHFTSPIRRYPDLQIHRIIKENLHGLLDETRLSHYNDILDEVGKKTSMTERNAEEAEREIEKTKKAEYMERFIGERFEGVISGVTGSAIFVELPNTVEGVIRLAKLTDDYYVFDQERYRVTGERRGKTYALGDRIEIVVSQTDKLLKLVEFMPAPTDDKDGEKQNHGKRRQKEFLPRRKQ